MDDLQDSFINKKNKDLGNNNLSNAEHKLLAYRPDTPTFDYDYDNAFNDLDDDTEPVLSGILKQIISQSVMNESSMESIEASDVQSTSKSKHEDVTLNYDSQDNNSELEKSTISKQICSENIVEVQNSENDSYCGIQKEFQDKKSSPAERAAEVKLDSKMLSIGTDDVHKNNVDETCFKEKSDVLNSLDENKSSSYLNKNIVDAIELKLSILCNEASRNSDLNKNVLDNEQRNNILKDKSELANVLSGVVESNSKPFTCSSPVSESSNQSISDVISNSNLATEGNNQGLNTFDISSVVPSEVSPNNEDMDNNQSLVQNKELNKDSSNMKDSFSDTQEDCSKQFVEIKLDSVENKNNEHTFDKNALLQVNDDLDIQTNISKFAEKTNEVSTISNLTNNEDCSLLIQDVSKTGKMCVYEYSNQETAVTDLVASRSINKTEKSNWISNKNQTERICLELNSVISEHITKEFLQSTLTPPLSKSKSVLHNDEQLKSDIKNSIQVEQSNQSITRTLHIVENVINYLKNNKTSIINKIVKMFDVRYDNKQNTENTTVTHTSLESPVDTSFEKSTNDESSLLRNSFQSFSDVQLHSSFPVKKGWTQMLKDFNKEIEKTSGTKKNKSKKKVVFKQKTKTYPADVQIKDQSQSDYSRLHSNNISQAIKSQNRFRNKIKPLINVRSQRSIKRPNYTEVEIEENNSSKSTKKSLSKRLLKMNPIKITNDSFKSELMSESDDGSETLSIDILSKPRKDKVKKKDLKKSSELIKPTYSCRKRAAKSRKPKTANSNTSSKDKKTVVPCVSNSPQGQKLDVKKSTRNSSKSLKSPSNSIVDGNPNKEETPKFINQTLSKKHNFDSSSDDDAPPIKKIKINSTVEKTKNKNVHTSKTKNKNIDEFSPSNEAKSNK